jgi:hypothetical protein
VHTDMDVKTVQKPRKKSKSKDTWLDPFTKRLLIVLGLVVPVLAYLILKPTPQHQARAIEQTKEFAAFIQTQPQLAEPAREVASEKPPTLAQQNPLPRTAQVTEPEATPFDPNTALSIEDRIEINNLASQWNQVDFVRDHHWRDQVESMFAIAERTQSPDVLDLIRRQIILAKVDEDQSNKIRAETWFERYLKIDNRPVPRKELEDLFMHAQP